MARSCWHRASSWWARRNRGWPPGGRKRRQPPGGRERLCGNVAPWPMRPAGAACLPCRPKYFLALQLPVDAAPPRVLRASSSPACIVDMQERPPVAVAAKSGEQAGCGGGGGGKATGRWCRRPPVLVPGLCVWSTVGPWQCTGQRGVWQKVDQPRGPRRHTGQRGGWRIAVHPPLARLGVVGSKQPPGGRKRQRPPGGRGRLGGVVPMQT